MVIDIGWHDKVLGGNTGPLSFSENGLSLITDDRKHPGAYSPMARLDALGHGWVVQSASAAARATASNTQ